VHELQYSAPSSVEEAVELLAETTRDPQVLAGGTDLLIRLRAGSCRSRHLVDVKRIPEMNDLSVNVRTGLRIGGAVSCALLVDHPTARRLYPGLVEAAALIGSTQIQNRATLAGNLCNGSPAADTTPALLVLDATCTLAGRGGRRQVAIADLLTAPGRTALEPAELLVEIRVPPPPRSSADAYQRLTPRSEMDIAVAGVGAQIELDADGRCRGARIALGAVGPRAFLATDAATSLLGARIDEVARTRAGTLAARAARPISDKRGPAAYRREITAVLTRRVVARAAQRAQETES